MRLNDLQIQQFGKLKEKSIYLEDGINVIYGSNGSGKSTLHGFIRGMLFGIPRYRGRASKTDPYTRYEPWDRPVDFAGTMGFSVGEKDFRIRRNFYKRDERAELICETDGERLSVEQGDLQMLLGDISENIYNNTVSVGQLRSETDEGMVRELQNRMNNYEGAGSADVDVERACQNLKKKKKEWEGRRKELEALQRRSEQEQENRVLYLRQEQEKLEEQRRNILEEKKKLQREQESVEKQICVLETEVPEHQPEKPFSGTEEVLGKKGFFTGIFVTGFLLLLGSVISLFGNKSLTGFAIFAVAGIWLITGGTVGINAVKKKIHVEKSRKKNPAEMSQEKLKELRGYQIELEKQQAHLSGKAETLVQQKEEKSVMQSNLLENLREDGGITSQLSSCDMEIESLNLALETLTELSAGMRKRIGSSLQNRMEEILGQITAGKYDRIFMDSEMKISLFEGNRQVPLGHFSRGTVEQVYFALRMAVSETLCEEPMPVLLDDVFAMYDEQRLEKTLAWLAKREGQVIIFTCHRREEELLRKLGIRTNVITLEESVC